MIFLIAWCSATVNFGGRPPDYLGPASRSRPCEVVDDFPHPALRGEGDLGDGREVNAPLERCRSRHGASPLMSYATVAVTAARTNGT